MTRVAVVGGGLAGLLAAYRLQTAGQSVTLLESAPALGGMISSVTVGGVAVDTGAEAYAVRGGTVRALCDELGIEVAPPQGQPHLWWSHGVFPMAEGILGIPASLSDPALAVLNDDERTELAADLSADPALGADATTIGELVRTRLGQAAVAKLVAPVAHGVYSLSPDKMPIAAFAPGLSEAVVSEGSLLRAVQKLRAPGAASVEQPIGGMYQLISVLAERLVAAGGEIRTSVPVTHLRRGTGGLVLTAQDGETFSAQRVVLAVPASTTAMLLGHLGVEITPPPVNAARHAVLGVTAEAVSGAPVGSGVLVAERDEVLFAKALTHYSAKWPWAKRNNQEILRLSYPSHIFPTRVQIMGDASRLLGVDLRDADVTGLASVSWEAMPTRIEAPNREYFVEIAAAVGVDLVGAWLDGNGIAAVVAGSKRVLR